MKRVDLSSLVVDVLGGKTTVTHGGLYVTMGELYGGQRNINTFFILIFSI